MSSEPPFRKRPSGLGRGLSSLLGEAAQEASISGSDRGGVQLVPVASIEPHLGQPRRYFDEAALDELAASIRTRGVIQPIIVRPADGHYQIVAGERRWRAAQLAKLHDVPVVVRELRDDQALEIAIIENVQRADLNAIEEGAAYEELITRFGRTQEDVAREVGKSRSHIANTVRLLKLPDQVKAWIREGKLTAGHARTLLGEADPQARARELIEGALTVRQAEQKKAEHRSAKKPGGKPAKDPNIADLEASISNRLGLKAQIIHKGDKGGEMRISYKSLEQLDELTRRLTRS